jgi:hypothetical protein
MGPNVLALNLFSENWHELEGWNLTLGQMWQTFFRPELNQLFDEESLPEDFDVWIAQALYPPNGKPIAKFNGEVRGVAKINASRPIQSGEAVTLADLDGIEKFDLPDDLLDHGHFTLINTPLGWGMFLIF